jgi:predicted aldo/keto reductase-like oxidoreductase
MQPGQTRERQTRRDFLRQTAVGALGAGMVAGALEPAARSETSDNACRLCGACQRACPARLPVPGLFHCLADADPIRARRRYRELTARGPLPPCGSCSACAQACPQGVAGRERVEEARRVLA